MGAVLHYIQRWLPLSEQYVDSHIEHSRYRGVVVARHARENHRVFPRPVFSLGWIPHRERVWPQGNIERRLITATLLALPSAKDAQLVHQHHGYRLGDCDNFVRRRNLPFVLSVHGHDLTSFFDRYPDWFLPRLLAANAVVVPSHFLASRAVDRGCDAARVHVCPVGVDVQWFTPAPMPYNRPEVVFVGRFVEKKGIDVLLRAWPRVRQAVPDALLRLLGHGPLESLARSGGDGVIVELTDPAARAEQVRAALRGARAVVSPSRTSQDGDVETLLLVNLEAQATGRPVVTTRHGGIPEYVDEGRTALLVDEGDERGLADALVEVLTDEDLALRLAAAGPGWAAKFDVRLCTARVDDLYDDLIGRRS